MEPIEPAEPDAPVPAPLASEPELPVLPISVALVPLPDVLEEPVPDTPEAPPLALEPVVAEPALPPVAPARIPELPPELALLPELPVPFELSLPFAPLHAESANAIVMPAATKIFFIICSLQFEKGSYEECK
ncbi:MAG TPA: hypothetical protein VGC70_13465, partial [Burkholderiales bacterium]